MARNDGKNYAVIRNAQYSYTTFFKEQVISWLENVEKIRRDKQLYNNFYDMFLKFSKIVETFEVELYNEK